MPYDEMNRNSMNSSEMRNPNTDIHDILMKIDKILLWHKCFNNKAMKVCQSSGYNGFKRLHRYNTRCFLNWHMCLENEAFDKFRFILETDYEDFDYTSRTLIDHLKNWDMKLGQDIEKLAMLNNEYRMLAGVGNKTAKKALRKMTKNHEKTGRWHKRFEETKSAHDQHELDDWLHEKYKKKEEKMK